MRRVFCFALTAVLLAGLGCVNKSPVISLGADALRLPGGVMRTVSVDVVDPEGDPVTITVSADRGFAIVDGAGVRYTAPDDAGDDSVRVQANDGTTQATATFVVTVDDPMAWSAPELVSDTPGNSKSPALAVSDDGTVHVAWHDFSDDPPTMRHASLSEGGWESATLDLGPDKVLRPQLVVDGAALHLVYERFIDGGYELMHTVREGGGWSEAELIGVGRKGSPALFDGELHVAWYGVDDAPSHAWLGLQGWVHEGLLPIDAPYINPIRLQLVATADGLELGILLSPGDTSYDMNVLRWTAEAGWETPEIIYVSPYLGAEEPAGATDPGGGARWVWAEQSPLEAWTYDIVTMGTAPGEEPLRTGIDGLNGAPAVAAPSDPGLQVAWIGESADLYVARQPFADEPRLISAASAGPRLTTDADGYVHLAWVSDVAGVEQVVYATTRPR